MKLREKRAETIIRKGFEESLEHQVRTRHPAVVRADWVESPLGSLLAVGDDDRLYMLSFIELSGMERRAALMQKRLKATIEMGESAAVKSIRKEMAGYFAGDLRRFRTPLGMTGTAFQMSVYEALHRVPFGNTITYAQLAERIGSPAAFRAAAQAVAQNPIHIIVPCHRVINTDGGLGGYAGGLERKRWLQDFEKRLLITDGVR